ncbi:UNVERIFIED_CONTAM: hypothetical protein NCL1_52704 [Trichonephila clavipes]
MFNIFLSISVVNSISPNGFEKPVSLTFSTLFTTSPGTTAFVDISGNIKGKITEGSRIKGASKKEIVDEIPSPIYKPPTQAKTTESPMEESNAKSSAEISSPVYIFAHHTTSSELYEDVLSTELSSEIHSILHIPTNQSKLSESSTEESNTELSIETLSPVNLSLDQTKTNGTSIEESSSLLPTVPQRSPTTSVPYSQENSTSDAFSTAVPSHELTQEDKLEFGGDAENVSSDEYSTPISERIPTLSVKASSSDITTPHTELTTITSEITSMLDVKTTLNSHSDDISSDVSTHQYEFSTATPAKDQILDAEATLSSLSSNISTDVTTPQFDLSSPTEIKFKETGSSKTNHTKTNYGVDESSFDIVPSTSPSTTVSQEANAENYSTQRSPGPLYDETTPYTESSSETPKEKESTTEKVSHTPPNFVRIKGQKPTVQTTTEVSVKMSSTESSTAHELTLNETSFDDTKVTEETGVKNAEEKDPYQHTKGQRPQIKQKPLLPVGVIPGESKLSGNLPISSTKRRPILVSVPGEGNCHLGKTSYKHGQDVTSTDVCKMSCQCSRGKIYCVEIKCEILHPENFANCQVVQNKSECCPHYECGSEVTKSIETIEVTVVDESTITPSKDINVPKDTDTSTVTSNTTDGTTVTDNSFKVYTTTSAAFETTTVGVTKPSDIDETFHGVTTTETIDSKEYATAASTTQAPFSIYVTQLGLTTTDYETSTSSVKTEFPTEEKIPDPIHKNESSTEISHSSTAFETTTVGVTKPSDIDETSHGVTTTETIDSKEYATAASTTQAPFSIYVTQLGLTTTDYETSTSSGKTQFPTGEKTPDSIHNKESSTQISHSSTAFETTTVGVTKPSDIDETSSGVTTTETIDSKEYSTAASTTQAPFSIYVTQLGLTTTEYETSTSSGITEFPTEEKSPDNIHNNESSTQISHSSTAFETTTVGVTKPSDIDETSHGVTTTETIDSNEYATAASTTEAPFSIYVTENDLTTTEYETSTSSGITEFPTEEKNPGPIHNKESSTQISHSSTAFETTTVGVTKPSDIDETSSGVTTTETIDSKEYATAANTTQAPFSIYVTQLAQTTTEYDTSTSSGNTEFPTEEKIPDPIHKKESSTQISHSSTAFETTTVGVTKPSDINEISHGVTTIETIDSKEYATAASTTEAPFSIYVTQLGLTTTDYETSTSSGKTEFPTEEKTPDPIHKKESSTQISHSSTTFETTTVGVTRPSDIDETSYGVTSGTEISYTTLEENHPSTLSSVTSVIPDNDASQFFTTEAPIKISISDPSETDLTEENFSDNDGASTLTTTEADQLLFNSLTTIDVNEETSTTFDDLEVKKLTDTSTIAEVTSSLPLTTERLTEGLTTHVSFDGEEIKSPPVSEQTTVSGETSKETSTNLIGMTTDKSITEEVSSEAGINEKNYTVHTNVETGSDHGNDTLIDKETHDESSFTSTKAPLTFSLTTEQAEEFKTHKTMTIPSRESTFTSSFGETTVKASTDFHSATSLPDEFSFQTTLQEVSSTQSSKVDSGSTTKYQPDVVKTTVVEGQDVKETSLSTDAEEYFTENKSSGSVTQTTLISKVPTTVLEIETSSKQPATEYPSTFESATDTSVGHEKINYPDENETSLDVNETSHHLEKNTSFIQEKVTTATPTTISQDSISSSVSEEFKHDGALPVSEESVLEHSDDEEGTIEAFTYPPKQTEKPESHIKFEEPHKIPTEEGIEGMFLLIFKI